MDQDPKGMVPMIWIGDLWRLPVVLIEILCFISVPILLGAAIRALWQRRIAVSVTTMLCIGIVLVFMIGFSPGYMGWLMD